MNNIYNTFWNIVNNIYNILSKWTSATRVPKDLWTNRPFGTSLHTLRTERISLARPPLFETANLKKHLFTLSSTEWCRVDSIAVNLTCLPVFQTACCANNRREDSWSISAQFESSMSILHLRVSVAITFSKLVTKPVPATRDTIQITLFQSAWPEACRKFKFVKIDV